MTGPKRNKKSSSRRTFLQQMGWAPALFLPAPIQNRLFSHGFAIPATRTQVHRLNFADTGFIPQYPERSPTDDIIRWAPPGTDEYVGEGYAAQIAASLAKWSRELRNSPFEQAALKTFVSASIESNLFKPAREKSIRSGNEIQVLRREFPSDVLNGSDRFLQEIQGYFSPLQQVRTADFEIYEFLQTMASPLTFKAAIRYEFVGSGADGSRESRIGSWQTQWIRNESGAWQATRWVAQVETVSRASDRLFTDITSQVLGETDSYKNQLLHGADYWRTVLDGAIGIDVYGNNGLAVGDFDNDGRDDLYVCQPAGLPNRLYRNRGDGTFDDVTEQAGVGVLDFSASALFADFENRGLQDLLVVCATGPLLFVNDGKGKFSIKKDAFQFARIPQGSFTHAAIADYDRDGRLDVYFCLYNYYQGLDQYRYPVPYFDARNGPPNYLFHNKGNWSFEDRTEASEMNVENDRYSFACSWGDSNGDGWPDLYVVNDFGRNVLYRNNRDGTFSSVSNSAHVNEAGAGMSACWLDFDNDGKQDIYAAGMWVAPGMRVFDDPHFHAGEPEEIRSLYRRHMAGNSLYRNQGDGTFESVGTKAGVEMGRWSWSTDAWDFDHDGYPDLYVANGYISGLDERDVSSFFWRQVVAKSPQDSRPSTAYERGWAAMNELIRSDSTWNGHERNVFYANNRDGTFSDISGPAGLDFRDDSRAFALADLDGDGRLEIILKNRNAPQIRILRNAMTGIGNSISFRLRGEKTNRDAVGATVTLTCGSLRQTKHVQAGSGFLSQHSKELFFGLADNSTGIKATIAWPSGLKQEFDNLPANHHIQINEGASTFQARQFDPSYSSRSNPSSVRTGESLPTSWATWLVEPVKAPEFSLPDLSGNLRRLSSFQGTPLVLLLWTTGSEDCRTQLHNFRRAYSTLRTRGVEVLALNFDDHENSPTPKQTTGEESLPFTLLGVDREMAAVYNIVYQYLFDRHRDLCLPTSLLIDETGAIVRVYQGVLDPRQILDDVASMPRTNAERTSKALPFPGVLCQSEFRRNALTYGVAFFQHGFLEQAEHAFQQAIEAEPSNADAYYNLGTVYLRRNAPQQARENLEQSVRFRPDYAEAWNNLGMLAAQAGDDTEAISNFERALELRPSYGTALVNLGNLYRRRGDLGQAETVLERARDSEPENPEVSYSLGMLYARRDDSERAEQYLKTAIRLKRDYPEALNNLGVLLTQQQRYGEAETDFRTCIEAAPAFDQAYLNLARLYVVLNDKQKARDILEALLRQQPNHTMAQQMLQLLY